MSTTAFMLIRFHQPCCQALDADLGAGVVVFQAKETENHSSVRKSGESGVCVKKRISMKAEVFMATPFTKSLGCVGGSISRSEQVRGANLDARQRFFVGSGRPVSVDPARRSPRYHETSLDL